jgi:hypothetical protein
VLLWNLVQWRAAHIPGVARANLHVGEAAQLALPGGVEAVELLPPEGKARTLPVHARRVTTRLDEPGLYEFRAGEVTYHAAANAMSREESDLATAATGRWGEWADETGQYLGAESFAWVLLLLAAAVLTLHLFVAARQGPLAG